MDPAGRQPYCFADVHAEKEELDALRRRYSLRSIRGSCRDDASRRPMGEEPRRGAPPMIGHLDSTLGPTVIAPRLLENVVRRVETPPWHALYRFVIGFLLVPLFWWWSSSDSTDWRLFPFFLFVLLVLRVVPAIVRHVLPFSRDLQAHWFRQRVMAKRCDSYQWRKSVWLGLGMATWVVPVGGTQSVEGFLALACLLSGGAGELVWRRVRQTDQISQFLPK